MLWALGASREYMPRNRELYWGDRMHNYLQPGAQYLRPSDMSAVMEVV